MNDPSILLRFQEYIASLPWGSFLWSLIGFAVALCACGVVIRLIAGKDSGFSQAIAAACGIQFTYLVVIGLYALLPMLRSRLGELPFLRVDRWQLVLYELTGAPEAVVHSGIVRLAILSVIVGLMESRMPRPKKLLKWLVWRMASAMLSMAVYSFLCMLLSAACPQIFGFWGMAAVVGLCVLVLVVWLLHILLGVTQSSEGKGVGGLHRFFFSSAAGRQITWAILSGGAFLVSLFLLNRGGIGTIAFTAFAFAPYAFAFFFVVLLMWLFTNVL